MDKITDYQLVDAGNRNKPEDLTENVKAMMEAGWEPLGPPISYGPGHCLAQAMVIYKRGGP